MKLVCRWAIAAFLVLAAQVAAAAELVVNGGFETNGGAGTSVFNGWTVFNGAGGSGSFYVQTGANSPLNGFPVAPPPAGTFAAMTDQTGPGSHVLYQDVAIPAGVTSATFSARVYVQSQAAFSTPSSLDHSVGPNQQARVDIVNPAAPIQDVGAGVLLPVFRTNVGDPLTQPYQVVTANLTPYRGTTVRLRFSQVDNQGYFNFGVDDVSVNTILADPVSVPTMSEWAMLIMVALMGLTALVTLRRR